MASGRDRARSELRVSIMDLIDASAWLLFRGTAVSLARKLDLERAIRRAGLAVHPYIYAARMIFFTFMTAVICASLAALVLVAVPNMFMQLIFIGLLAIAPLIVFGCFVLYLHVKTSSRARGVEHELPFFAAYLTTMARGGVAPERVIETIARMKLFKALREEAERIVRDVKVFGKDPLTAIDDVVFDHPSRLFREFMLGYTTTVRTGGDVVHYLELRTHDLFRRKIEDIRMLSERIGLVVEAFIALNVVMALCFYVFFVVSSILPAKGVAFGGVGGFIVFALIVQPLLTLMLLVVTDAMMPKDPVWDKSVYVYPMLTIPVGLALGFVLFIALGGYGMLMGLPPKPQHLYASIASMCVGLTIASMGGIKAWIEKRRFERGLGVQLANFLRDLAETRKTGISVEKCILYLAQREYGVLTPIVRRIAGALAIGIDIGKAIRRALRGVYNWVTLMSFKYLIDAIEYGGAAPQVLDTLARYVDELTAIYDELKRRLKTYIIVPYFGALLLSFTTLLVLGMMAKSVYTVLGTLGATGTYGATVMGLRVSLGARDIALVTITTVLGCMLNSWLMGLMCGKLRDLTILSGFVHALILVAITTVASIVGVAMFIAPLLAS